jgi:CRP-like cAMP-binding protein
MYKNIDRTTIFIGLSPEKIRELLLNKEHFTRLFYKDNYVAYRNEETKYLMIILAGNIQSMISNDSGKVKKIVVLPKYSTIAPAFLFGKNNKFPVDVKSIEESLILYIGKNALLKIIQENSTVLNNYLNIISNKAQVLSQEIWSGFSNNTIKKKITNYLQNNLNPETKIITFDKSLEELAKYFDVSRPSLSRALNEFIKNGIIEKIERGKYLVKDFDVLG